jgi:hypothetical protein
MGVSVAGSTRRGLGGLAGLAVPRCWLRNAAGPGVGVARRRQLHESLVGRRGVSVWDPIDPHPLTDRIG